MPWALDVAARAESTVKTCSCVWTPDAPTQCRNSSPRRRWHGRQRSQRGPSAHAWMLATRTGRGAGMIVEATAADVTAIPAVLREEVCYHHRCNPMRHGRSYYGHEGASGSCGRWAARVIALLGESLARGTTSVAGVSSNRRSGDERRWAAFGWALTACLRSSAWSRPFFPSPPARRPSPRHESRAATKAF